MYDSIDSVCKDADDPALYYVKLESMGAKLINQDFTAVTTISIFLIAPQVVQLQCTWSPPLNRAVSGKCILRYPPNIALAKTLHALQPGYKCWFGLRFTWQQGNCHHGPEQKPDPHAVSKKLKAMQWLCKRQLSAPGPWVGAGVPMETHHTLLRCWLCMCRVN